MAEYTNEYSNFPSKLITKHEFRDVTDEIASLINQIQMLRNSGKYGEAGKLIREYDDILIHYSIDSTVINTIIEELRNTQIYAKKSGQYIYTESTEPDCSVGDVWIGGI